MEGKKPGTTRIALGASIVFGLALAGIVVAYIVLVAMGKPVEQTFYGLVALVVGAILTRMEQIFNFFMGKE